MINRSATDRRSQIGLPSGRGMAFQSEASHRSGRADRDQDRAADREGDSKALNDTFVKLVSWYDNEWGFQCLLITT